MTTQKLADLRKRIGTANFKMNIDHFAAAIGEERKGKHPSAYLEEKWKAFQELSRSVRNLGPLFDVLFADDEEAS